MSFALSTGAEARWTGEPGSLAVVCVDGGTAAEVPGTWSASVEWLVRAVAPSLPSLAFLEVRYRVKSWRRLDSCVEDAQAALDAVRAAGAEPAALLAFSMGGAVAVRACVSETQGSVRTIVGVNPWLPPQLGLEALRGRRLAIAHGSLDAPLPGIPGVRPSLSAAAAARAGGLGADVERTVIPGAFHAVALRRRWNGRLQPLPGSGRYRRFVARELERLCT